MIYNHKTSPKPLNKMTHKLPYPPNHFHSPLQLTILKYFNTNERGKKQTKKEKTTVVFSSIL